MSYFIHVILAKIIFKANLGSNNKISSLNQSKLVSKSDTSHIHTQKISRPLTPLPSQRAAK